MAIRSAQVTDLARIDDIYQQGKQLSLQGEGATHPIRLWQMLTRTFSSLLPLATPSEMLYVLEDDHDRVVAFIQAEILSSADGRSRSRTPEAIRVLNLSLAPSLAAAAGGALIDHLCNEAINRRVGRIYVRIPELHPVLESFKAHMFRQYAQDRVFLRDELGQAARGDAVGLRPARRKDLLGLFTLYLAATPKAVSQVEAPDFEQWRAVHESEWLERFGRRGSRSLVVERNNEVIAWLGVEPGQPGRPHTISIMARADHSDKGGLQAQLLAQAQRLLAPQGAGAVWCNVRNYDTETTAVLQEAGFEPLAGQELLVRELRARAVAPARRAKKEKALAPVFGAVL